MATLQSTGGIFSAVQSTSYRRAGSPTPTRFGPSGELAYGFIRHCFKPIPRYGLEIGDKTQVEQSFYTSLWHVCQLYKLDYDALVETTLEFPFSIGAARDKLSVLLEGQDQHIRVLILRDDTRMATLGIEKKCPSPYNLFYIPIKAIYDYQLSEAPADAKKLIDSIMAYLLHRVQIPLYANESEYLFGQYESLVDDNQQTRQELIEKNDEAARKELGEMADLSVEWETIKKMGKQVFDRTRHPQHLRRFSHRIAAFRPQSDFESQLLTLGRRLEQLYKNYPNESIYSQSNGLDTDGEEEVINEFSLYQTIAFVWDLQDDFFDSLVEYTHMDMQETTRYEEPTQLQIFDQLQTAISFDFTFSQTLFSCLDQFYDLFHPKQPTTHEPTEHHQPV